MTIIKASDFSRVLKNESTLLTTNRLLTGLFFCMAVLFSQAVIFDAVAPFFIPFWLIVRTRYQAYQGAVLIGGFIGVANLAIGQAFLMAVIIIVLELLLAIRKVAIPKSVCMLLAVGVVQIIWQWLSYSGMPPLLVQVYIGYELFFAAVAWLFMQQFFVSFYEFRTKAWSTERLVAGFVVFSLLLIGMQSMNFFYFSLSILVMHMAICLAAIIGGMASSLLMAVVVGMLVGVAQLSFTGMLALYAVTGVTVGITYRMGRLAIVASSLMPSLFFLVYDATLPLDAVYFVSILTAGIVVLLIPEPLLKQAKSFYAAQTTSTHQPVMTADHLLSFQQFVYFLKQLVFEQFTLQGPVRQDIEPLPVCLTCFRRSHCWGESEIKEPIEQWVSAKTLQKPLEVVRREEQLKGRCIKPQKLLEQLEQKLYDAQMNGRFYHGKKMMALQLSDLSDHLQSVLEEQQSIQIRQTDETALIHYFEEHGILCTMARWEQTGLGERELVCHVVSEEQAFELLQNISQLLTDFLGEPIRGYDAIEYDKPFYFVELYFQSAVRYELAYDIYKRTEQGSVVSGDSHSVFSLRPGLMAIMLSDGMGTSYRAQQESERVIEMMRNCLSYQMNPETAMHTMHYVLSLKTHTDFYATLDFGLLDLQRGELWCWKAGGMTTYILRGSDVIKVESRTAPIGFMTNFSIETERQVLQDGDCIVMVSDGLFSSEENWQTQEQMFLQFVRHSVRKQVQLNVVLYDVMSQYEQRYKIEDDCTIMLFSLQHITQQWAVFKTE